MILVRWFLQELKVFLVGIALFAGLALLMGRDTALVLALFTLSGGLLAAGQLLFWAIRSGNRT